MTHALRMRWIDLAFLHWRVPADDIRALLPPPLEVDLFDGSAWVAVVPFRMTVRRLFASPIPTTTDFPELNVRTYVRHGGHSGVWFFSLDAASWLMVLGSRTAVGLPYFHARMQERRDGDQIHYESTRTHPGARAAVFRARYRPTGGVYLADPGSLDYWLTERYSLFAMHTGQLLRLDIEHAQWPLQQATADVERNTMVSVSGITLPNDAPHVRFARALDVIAHWPVRA